MILGVEPFHVLVTLLAGGTAGLGFVLRMTIRIEKIVTYLKMHDPEGTEGIL